MQVPWISSLPMYDFDEILDQTQQLWQIINHALISIDEKPTQLFRPESLILDNLILENLLVEHWRSDQLFLSQSCGWPLTNQLKIEPLVTPIYDLPGCAEGLYSSAIIVHKNSKIKTIDKLNDAQLVINTTDSWSGFRTLIQSFKNWGLMPNWKTPIISGSHRQSLIDVMNNKADFAAIDAVSWHYLNQIDAKFKMLKVLAWTKRVPALPLISNLPEPLQLKIRNILLAMPKDDFNGVSKLGITGFKHFSLEQYQAALKI